MMLSLSDADNQCTTYYVILTPALTRSVAAISANTVSPRQPLMTQVQHWVKTAH